MTTGNRTVNRQVPYVSPTWKSCSCNDDQATGFVGYKSTKVWSGSNTAASPSVASSPPETFTYYYPYVTKDRKGKTITKFKKRTRRTTIRQKKPFKGKQDNPYSMNGTSRYDVAFPISQKCISAQAPCFVSATKGMQTTSNFTVPRTHTWNSDSDYKLIGKLSKKLQGDSFNMAVFLGEGKEALATIMDSATRITKAYKSLRKGNPLKALDDLLGGRPNVERYRYADKGARQVRPKPSDIIDRKRVTEEWFANNWLAFSYAWSPLVQDAYGAARHLAYTLNRPLLLKYRTSLSVAGYFNPGSVQGIGEVYTRKSIIANVSHIDEVGLIGLKDPASLAWELLPYSFVIDWFIPIGNYLEAKQLANSLTAIYVTSSKVYSKATGFIYNTGGAAPTKGSPEQFWDEVVSFSRTISSSLNVPKPVLKGLGQMDSWRRCTNAVALLINGTSLFRH